MIKAEMLNEMNPKLRALLAAGLIGTAGLGATSCSTPNDDYEEPTVIEQPATPETPGSTTETPIETENTKETVALSGFKALGVEDYAENLAKAKKLRIRNSNGEVEIAKYDAIPIPEGKTVYIYRNGSFELASSKDEDAYDDVSERRDIIYVCYKESNNRYFIPVSMLDILVDAISIYSAHL